LLDLVFRGDLVHERFQIVILKRRHIHADQFAVDPQHRRISRRKMKIGGILLLHEFEKRVDPGHIDLLQKLDGCHVQKTRDYAENNLRSVRAVKGEVHAVYARFFDESEAFFAGRFVP
jgi:hypothetical protein